MAVGGLEMEQYDWPREKEEGAGQVGPARLGPVSSHAHPCRMRTGFLFILNFKRVHSKFLSRRVVVSALYLFQGYGAAPDATGAQQG